MKPIIAWPRRRPRTALRAAAAVVSAVAEDRARAVDAVVKAANAAGLGAVDRVDRSGKIRGPAVRRGREW
jgi:hypothetical protein